MFVFASLSQSTTDSWLQAHHRSVGTGYTNTLESDYASTFRNRYPVAFVGDKKDILPNDIIHIFKDISTWRGNGVGDGTKERLLSAIRLAVDRQARYCRDNLSDTILQETAIETARYTERWFGAFVCHVDDEMNMLKSLGLQEKQIMLLVTHQLVSICDDLFVYRQMGVNVNPSDKAETACRYAMCTLQSLVKMDE